MVCSINDINLSYFLNTKLYNLHIKQPVVSICSAFFISFCKFLVYIKLGIFCIVFISNSNLNEQVIVFKMENFINILNNPIYQYIDHNNIPSELVLKLFCNQIQFMCNSIPNYIDLNISYHTVSDFFKTEDHLYIGSKSQTIMIINDEEYENFSIILIDNSNEESITMEVLHNTTIPVSEGLADACNTEMYDTFNQRFSKFNNIFHKFQTNPTIETEQEKLLIKFLVYAMYKKLIDYDDDLNVIELVNRRAHIQEVTTFGVPCVLLYYQILHIINIIETHQYDVITMWYNCTSNDELIKDVRTTLFEKPIEVSYIDLQHSDPLGIMQFVNNYIENIVIYNREE